ncbi:hypothetical protein JCM8202v2_006157 [Rhodotorula sphaerocarpa]
MPDQSVRASAPPTIHVSPASPRNASGSRPAPPAPRTDAADQDRSGTEAKRIVPADAGRGGVESSPRARSPVKAPPLQKRASHASTAGSASTAPRSDRSFLGSIASALPTFSLSSFRLPGAPTFETVEHDRESDVSERDVAARDEEDEASDSTESDLSSDEDEAVSEAPDFVVNRSTEPLPNLPHGGEGNEQVDLRNSPDLRIEDAVEGPALVSDTPVSGSPLPTPASPEHSSSPRTGAKPGFPLLARTPSSAFVAASKEGSINPLTLHAIARRDSEQEAIRMVHERNETERRREDSGHSTVRGGGGAGTKGTGSEPQTPIRGAFVGVSGATARSDSPAPMSDDERSKARKKWPTGLGRVQGETPSVRSASSGPGLPRTATQSSAGSRSQAQPSTSRIIPDRHRAVSEAHSLAPSLLGGSAAGTEAKRKKPGFFSRFGRKKDRSDPAPPPVPSLPDQVRSQDRDDASLSPHSPATDMTPPRKSSSSFAAPPREKVRVAKVKARGKSHKDFGRLFLAQELVISPVGVRTHRPSVGSADDESVHSTLTGDNASMHSKTSRSKTEDGAPVVEPKKKQNAVWTTKFSEDGKYLAVGGKDGVVRVWEVLSTPEDRATTMQPTSPLDGAFAQDPSSSAPSSGAAPPPTIVTGSGKKKGTPRRRAPACLLPVFASHPVREYIGHDADVLDLSWSKNNFLLSSSMDKTVRLWHVSRAECLCAFQHLDFVTSIAFHPKDDRFFLSGSLDCKLRLWNIPEKRIWTELPELITSVAFTRDGKFAIAGSFAGVCIFLEVETFRFHSMFAAKSTRGKNVKGKKVTSLCAFPLPSSTERLLVTTNDSRMRLYHASDKIVEAKYAGHENTSSQIRASFSDDGRWIISGSEDRHVYIWDSGLGPSSGGGFSLKKKFKEGGGYEYFPMPAHIVTSAVFAPTRSRMHLSHAGDPIFADGRTHLALLERTLSGNSLDLIGTQSRLSGGTDSAGPSIQEGIDLADRNVLVPATSRDGSIVSGVDSAEHAIIVVADDETGIISVFRNSPIPPEVSTDGKHTRHDRGASTGLGRDRSKRWSRASATPSEAGR